MDAELQKKIQDVWSAMDRGEIDNRAAGRQVTELLGHTTPTISPERRAAMDDLSARLKAAGVYDGWGLPHQSKS